MKRREDDEKKALGLHRYKMWVETLEARHQELVSLQEQLNQVAEQVISAYLEAREEQESLIELGMTRDQMELVAKLPMVAIDPLALLKQATANAGG